MKKVIITLILLAVSIATGNAQLFVEGGVSGVYMGETSSLDGITKELPSYFDLNLSFSAGYRLNEKTSLGVSATRFKRAYSTEIIDLNTGDREPTEVNQHGWSFAVFDRYKIWGPKKISFMLESSFYFNKNTFEGHGGLAQFWNTTHSLIGVKALPLISYNLSDRFSIIASTDFLSMNLSYLVINYKDTGMKTSSWGFGFDAQSTIFDRLSSIRIGIIYHFKNQANE